MLNLFLMFIFILFNKIIIVFSTMTINEPQENCMISLVIPKESIKATCNGGSSGKDYHTEQKLKSIEGQLQSIRKDMNNLNIRLTYTINRNGNDRDNGEISKILGQLETTVTDLQMNFTKDREQGTEKEAGREVLNKKKVARMIRSTLKRELADIKEVMKEEIKRDIHYEFRQQLKDDIRSELLSYAAKNNKLVNGIDSEILLNTRENGIDQHQKRNYHGSNAKTEKHYKHDLSNQRRHIQEEYDAMESALNNELPEKSQSRILQPIGQTTKELDVKEVIVILNSEVKKHLDKQTKKVKDIVGHHLNLTESKLSKVSENLNEKYDKFETRSTGKEYKEISEKIEQIEHNVDTLGTSLTSLLQGNNNVFSNEIKRQLELEKVEMENNVMHKLSDRSNPFKQDLENLKNKTRAMSNLIQATRDFQIQTRSSLKIFNATYRRQNDDLEQTIRRMTKQIQELNTTVNPDYEDALTLEEAFHDLDVQDAITFVAEIRDIWPAVLDNISSIVQVHKNDLDFVEEGFQHMRDKFEHVTENQTQCFQRIDKLTTEVRKIKERIAFNEQIETQQALDKNEWAQFNFNHTYGRSGCFGGKKFVKKTGYEVGVYVGVVLCTEKRYKIYLSDSLNEIFLNVGDTDKNGEDHCEFVGADKNTPVDLKKGEAMFERIPGYKRGNWGEVPMKGKLSFFSPTPEWYECGVTIP